MRWRFKAHLQRTTTLHEFLIYFTHIFYPWKILSCAKFLRILYDVLNTDSVKDFRFSFRKLSIEVIHPIDICVVLNIKYNWNLPEWLSSSSNRYVNNTNVPYLCVNPNCLMLNSRSFPLLIFMKKTRQCRNIHTRGEKLCDRVLTANQVQVDWWSLRGYDDTILSRTLKSRGCVKHSYAVNKGQRRPE